MARSYFFSHPRDDLPPLGYPLDPAVVPDGWTVWAFGDIHGVASGFRAALEEAGLVDGDCRWTGGARVALIGLGDYIDRGPDSAGVIDLLRVLAWEMEAAGSRQILVRGNHEQMLADILRFSDEWFASWARNGGHALAGSYGVQQAMSRAGDLRHALLDRFPGLLTWLLATVAYARWRDVIFVHAGLPPGATPGSLLEDDRQLWDPDAWFVSSAGLEFEPALAAFREAGLHRVVAGHQPQNDGPTIDHAGSLLLLDTNACGLRWPGGIQMTSYVTLARIPDTASFEDAEYVMVDTAESVDRGRP